MPTVVTVSQLPEVMVMKQQLAVHRRPAHAFVTHALSAEEKAERLADLRRRHQLEVERDARSLRQG